MKTILLILALAAPAFGATKFLRADANGTGSGDSWENAYTTLSALESGLARGDTGYVADGVYDGGVTFNTARSGTSLITIKKATASDHGSDTGWQSSYGDGQAVFTNSVSFQTGYILWSGQVGAFSATNNAVSIPFGFVIYDPDANGGGAVDVVDFSQGANELTFSYTHAYGVTNMGDWTYASAVTGLHFGKVTNITISHCYVHGADSIMYAGNGVTTDGFDSTGLIIEHSTFQAARAGAPAHCNLFYCTGTENGIFRYNYSFNYRDEGLFFTGWEGSPQGWKVYGNVFSGLAGPSAPTNPRGIEIRADYSYTNIAIYNNTFVTLGIGGFMERSVDCVDCTATNNLSYGSPNMIGDILAGSNTDDNTDRFVSLAGFNFRLTDALAGTALASEFNTDMDGNTRGSDGTWDIGAFEFVGSSPAPPSGGNGSARANRVRVGNLIKR